MLLFGNKSHEAFLAFQGVLREVTTHFIVDVRALQKAGGNHVKVHIISPSGTNVDNYITDKGDGTYRVEYTAFEDGRNQRNLFSLPVERKGEERRQERK